MLALTRTADLFVNQDLLWSKEMFAILYRIYPGIDTLIRALPLLSVQAKRLGFFVQELRN